MGLVTGFKYFYCWNLLFAMIWENVLVPEKCFSASVRGTQRDTQGWQLCPLQAIPKPLAWMWFLWWKIYSNMLWIAHSHGPWTGILSKCLFSPKMFPYNPDPCAGIFQSYSHFPQCLTNVQKVFPKQRTDKSSKEVAPYAVYYAGIPDESFIPSASNMSLDLDNG